MFTPEKCGYLLLGYKIWKSPSLHQSSNHPGNIVIQIQKKPWNPESFYKFHSVQYSCTLEILSPWLQKKWRNVIIHLSNCNWCFRLDSKVINYYLTRAGNSPTSDPGKPVLGCLSVCTGLFRECNKGITIWLRYHEQSARTTMPAHKDTESFYIENQKLLKVLLKHL